MAGTFFWAYAIDRDKNCVLVYTSSEDVALHEREILKSSDAKTVGSVTRLRLTETEVRNQISKRGINSFVVRAATQQ